jgi:hypothetical protein
MGHQIIDYNGKLLSSAIVNEKIDPRQIHKK